MPKLEPCEDGFHWFFKCPGCNVGHQFDTRRWQFNGDVEKPTFTPSLLYNGDLGNPRRPRCHSFVTDGNIQFLDDCTHALAGQTVPIPDASELWT